MLRRYPGLALATLLPLMGSALPAQSPASNARVYSLRADSLATALDLQAPQWLAAHRVPSIAVAYIEGGVVRWTRVYGEQSPGVPATIRTLYNVASLTKPVFAELALRAVEDGRVTLDEPMSRSWIDPDLADDPRVHALTLRLALSHQTGFRGNWRSQNGGVLQFETRPGTRYSYSGEGYAYASRFMTRKLGTPLDSLARRYLFAPLGMTSTSFTRRSWFEGRIATPRNIQSTDITPFFGAEASAADDLYATIGDYAAFVAAVMNHGGIAPSVSRQRDSIHAIEPVLTADCDAHVVGRCPVRAGHGLGWSIWRYQHETVFVHTGGDEGEKSIAYYVPEQRRGAVVLTNGAWGFLTYTAVLKHLFGSPPAVRLMEENGCREATRAGLDVAAIAARAGVKTTFCRVPPPGKRANG